jgi:rhodanese-related sulfurtransferase
MSPKSAGLAVKWGHKDVLAYTDGMPAWKKSGKKISPSLDYVAKGNIVLLDLRDRKAAESGTIPRSYSIPLADLEDAEDALPKSLGAPLYIFGENDAMVKNGAKILKEIGYKNIVPFYGALEAWVNSGRDLQKGPVLTATDELPIVWERTLGDGEISISDFTKSLQSDLIKIIDARTPAEYESGHFPGSVNIPLEEMKARMSEIPKDKFIVVHCKTGGRGEIGYRMLKESGYSVKFLNAECECSTTGQFEIW